MSSEVKRLKNDKSDEQTLRLRNYQTTVRKSPCRERYRDPNDKDSTNVQFPKIDAMRNPTFQPHQDHAKFSQVLSQICIP